MRLKPFLAAILLAACADFRATTESWHGKSLDALVASWGPPAASHEFADGRKVIGYGHQHTVGGINPYAPYQTAVYECSVTFTADRSGTIVSSDVQGNLGGCNHLFRTKGPAP